jgi:hypothetical protein
VTRDHLAFVRDDLQMRQRRREVVRRGNRSRLRRSNVRDRRIKAVEHGLRAGLQKCRPIDWFLSLMSSRFHVIEDG